MNKKEKINITKKLYHMIIIFAVVFILTIFKLIPKNIGYLSLFVIYFISIYNFSSIKFEFNRSKFIVKFFFISDYLVFLLCSFNFLRIIMFIVWFGIFIYFTIQDEKENAIEFTVIYGLTKLIFIVLLVLLS